MVCGPCLWYIRPIQFHCIIFFSISLSLSRLEKEQDEEEEEEEKQSRNVLSSFGADPSLLFILILYSIIYLTFNLGKNLTTMSSSRTLYRYLSRSFVLFIFFFYFDARTHNKMSLALSHTSNNIFCSLARTLSLSFSLFQLHVILSFFFV